MTQDELFDKLAIREVLERYMRYNDDGDVERLVDLFDDHAVLQVVGKHLVGRVAIHDFFRAASPTDHAPVTRPGELLKQPGSVHLCSNPVIDIDGDTATSELDFHVLRRDESGRAVTVLLGRYRDRLRRLDTGQWVITSRVGVSVARPGEAGTDAEWRRILDALPADESEEYLR